MSRYEGGLDPWSRALGWWGDKGASARVELYTRWTFHCVALIQLLAVAGPVALSDGPGAPRAVLATLLALHSGLTALTCSRALGSLLDHREPPMRLVAAHVALSGLVVVVAVTLARAGTDPAQRSMAVAVALGPVIFGPMAPALVARPGRVAQLVLSFSVALVLLMSALSLPWQQTVVLGTASLGGGLLMAFSSRFSVWLLAVVLELESARVNPGPAGGGRGTAADRQGPARCDGKEPDGDRPQGRAGRAVGAARLTGGRGADGRGAAHRP
ncbi:hypothetical protein ACWEQU_27760 [Streptomyces nodosus]